MTRRLHLRRGSLGILQTLCLLVVVSSAAAITVSAPGSPPAADSNIVFSDFLGLSLELSFINYYFGNSTAEIPQPFVQHMMRLCQHASGKPCRMRLGGNSMDSSTYVPNQQQPIIFTDPNANYNDQPVDYGPQLFETMKGVSTAVGGAQYLIGLSLRDPNSSNIPLLAGDSAKFLGNDLDAWLLGNEPDLYSKHGQRPNIANYTVDDYIEDYQTVFNNLQNTPQGNVLKLDVIGGPTICCSWDLATLLQSSWFDTYKQQLKYITLQHYPTNSCSGAPPFGIEWFTIHANTVGLAEWNEHGLQIAAQARKPVLMDEFNTVSCGGYPGISDVFGAALWITDYSLQLAVQGFAGAYIHTREPGVTYNVFDAPPGVAGGAGPWTTNPAYYGMIPVAEALEATNGSRVVDLNLQNSVTDQKATTAGYAIYDGASPTVHSIVLLNFADASGATSDYSIDKAYLPQGANNVTVRFLVAPSIKEKTNIAYGGKTYAGVGDGNAVDATFAGSLPDKSLQCDGGCTVQIPGPGLAVVFVGGEKSVTTTTNNNNTNANSASISPVATGTTTTKTKTNGAMRASHGRVGAILLGVALYTLVKAL